MKKKKGQETAGKRLLQRLPITDCQVHITGDKKEKRNYNTDYLKQKDAGEPSADGLVSARPKKAPRPRS